MADSKEFKPKYVARVEISKDQYRYFYTQAEYQAYLKSKDKTKDTTKKTEPKRKSILSGLFSKLKGAISNASKTAKKVSSSLAKCVKNGAAAVEKTIKKTGDTLVSKVASSDVVKTGEKVINGFMKKAGISTKKQTKSAPTITPEKAANGKNHADMALKKLGDEPVGSVAAAAVVSTGAKVVAPLLAGLFGALAAAAVAVVKNVVAPAIKNLIDKKKEKEAAKKAEKERRAKLSEEYVDWLDSESPKSFDELQMKDEHTSSPDSWDGVWDDALDINENYAEARNLLPPDVAATENCSYCTAAYDLRQRGYDVEAAPYDPSDPPTTISELMSWYDKPELHTRTYNPYAMDSNGVPESAKAASEILDELYAQGNGARGNFCVYWQNGGGHSVVYEVRNDEVYLIDCQTQRLFTVAELVSHGRAVSYFRTDNIEPNEKILDKVRNDDD